MQTARKVLLAAAQTTGNSTGKVVYAGGVHEWSVYGTWDGASAQLQLSPDDGTTWVDKDGAVLTANGSWQDVNIPAGFQARTALTGAGGTTSLNSELGGQG